MEAHLQEIREQQKASWNKFSSGWKKWDDFTMDWLKPMGDEIIRYLDLKRTDTVLDIAAGTGEPGLTIANIVKNGKVVITDLAESMLEVAHENAGKKGIKNYETVACDVCELPFDDETFDAVSCRLGFMFFPDMLMAAKEMVRVLKPGRKISTSVWAMPEKNFWINAMMSTVNRNLQLPPPKPGGPGMIRCAAPGVLAGLFRQAGLKNVSEMEITGKLNCGSNDNYWNFMNEVVAPVVAVMNKADDATKEKIKREVYELVDKENPDKKVALGYAALIVCGEK
ncbi:MAG TPA: class I SAM-dependent methyltransferase [Chitinophagaceae bacterium]|nr:class I SAM-dependent methyltransferase [Chitinophagaceae bacterium]